MTHPLYVPFTANDFALTGRLGPDTAMPEELTDRIDTLRRALGQFPEFSLATFKRHVLRRSEPVAAEGLVFSAPQKHVGHWFIYSLGGEDDQIHLNIGMWPTHLRIGLGFAVGHQVKSTLPAFRQFQHFLGIRPPLLFRDAFFRCVKRHGLGLEDAGMPYWGEAHDVLNRLETYTAPDHREAGILLVVGALWKADVLERKTIPDIRNVLKDLLPFFEAMILMGGRLEQLDPS